jgi:uncharacterized glyoxalase superfamily protein PhnB
MPEKNANGAQAIVPMIAYEDGAVAIDWLVRAFGFQEVTRISGDDGRISHAELEHGGGVIMLASPTPDYQSPRRHREQCEPARKWSAVPWIIDGVMVQVSDADAHHQQARAAWAHVLSEPEDQPYGRIYRAEDLEGHCWMFMQASK